MKLESIGFGAQLAIGGNLHGNGRFDAIHEKIILSETECLILHNMKELHNIMIDCSLIERRGLFIDRYGSPQTLNVIAFKREENHQEMWTFLCYSKCYSKCNSKELFLALAREFKLAYTLEAILWKEDPFCLDDGMEKEIETSYGEAGPNAARFVKRVSDLSALYNEKQRNKEKGISVPDDSAYDAYCAFFKYLLEEGEKERRASAYDAFSLRDGAKKEDYTYSVTGCKFHMPDDKKYFEPKIEKCLICDSWRFDKVYEFISCFLPQNIKMKVAWEIKQLRRMYGKDFEKRDKILEDYRRSVSAEDFLTKISEVQAEIEHWRKLIKDEIAEKDFGEAYFAVLQDKMNMLRNEIRKELEKCDFDPRSVEDNKYRMIHWSEKLSGGDYEKITNLYQEYCTKESRLQKILVNAKDDFNDMEILQYYNFYHFGRILIGDCYNKIENDKTKKKNFSQKDLDDAMMYFYETDTVWEAENMRVQYQNRKKGKRGEQEVDYVLKHLGGNYRTVPKKLTQWDRWHWDELIRLYNPDSVYGKREYDHIVVGKQGVFVIETKNYKGTLVIDKNGNWIRGGEGEKSPVQQIDWNIKLLKTFLKDIPVIGIICIAHPKAIIKGEENSLYSIIKYDSLDRFIQNYPAVDRELTMEEIEECLLLIEKYRYQAEGEKEIPQNY